jgi:hypothetical protein
MHFLHEIKYGDEIILSEDAIREANLAFAEAETFFDDLILVDPSFASQAAT